MTKKELVDVVASKTGQTKAAVNKVLDIAFEEINALVVNGDNIRLNVGTFSSKIRNQRQGLNPQTKEKMIIPAKKVPTFKSPKEVRDQLAAQK